MKKDVKIIINTSCKQGGLKSLTLLKYIIDKNGWIEKSKGPRGHFFWIPPTLTYETFSLMHEKVRVFNRIPGFEEVSTKATTGMIM